MASGELTGLFDLFVDKELYINWSSCCRVRMSGSYSSSWFPVVISVSLLREYWKQYLMLLPDYSTSSTAQFLLPR